MKQNTVFERLRWPKTIGVIVLAMGVGLCSVQFMISSSSMNGVLNNIVLLVSQRFHMGMGEESSQAQQTKPVTPIVSISQASVPDIPKFPSSYHGIIADAANRNGLNEALIMAVMAAESNFNPKAISSSGAHGLMQLMPETARTYGVSDTFDPRQSISAGARYLSYLMNRFDGNLKLVLAAYNAGPTSVVRSGYKVPPIAETQDYVKKVLAYYTYYQGI
ncbi:MAG TPA: lytic transglycosylase domain-containing protein [Burkholderiales bacterium]|nr:lytic transglycosylase domain-containing protein [Burkholderiales bacterium]